jgi:hypothetical protein
LGVGNGLEEIAARYFHNHDDSLHQTIYLDFCNNLNSKTRAHGVYHLLSFKMRKKKKHSGIICLIHLNPKTTAMALPEATLTNHHILIQQKKNKNKKKKTSPIDRQPLPIQHDRYPIPLNILQPPPHPPLRVHLELLLRLDPGMQLLGVCRARLGDDDSPATSIGSISSSIGSVITVTGGCCPMLLLLLLYLWLAAPLGRRVGGGGGGGCNGLGGGGVGFGLGFAAAAFLEEAHDRADGSFAGAGFVAGGGGVVVAGEGRFGYYYYRDERGVGGGGFAVADFLG